MTRKSNRYYWIKLKTNFFSVDEIDFLLGQENGCQYVVLYQMLCLMTANNEGQLAANMGEILVPYDTKKIVRETKYFDFDTVTVALELFKKLGLIYVQENSVMKVAGIENMVGSETAYAEKKRLYRKKQKLLADNVEDNVREEIEKEIDIDIEIEKEIDNRERVDYNSIIDAYHQHCPSLPHVRNISEARKKAIKARLKSYSEEDLIEAFQKAESSKFLKGGNDRNWTADFDWIMKDANIAKILDGKYDNKFEENTKEGRLDWLDDWGR